MKLKVIITGATGMIGEGVLQECLQHDDVEELLVVGRRPCGVTHPKLREIIHPDFYYLAAIQDQLIGFNCCLFCLGVSSVGMKEDAYFRATYILTMNFATTLVNRNPDMTFCYISGRGTDSTEKGKSMWARVKGKTENDLMKLPFKRVYNFRPGIVRPAKGARNTLTLYKYMCWLIPVINFFWRNSVLPTQDLGRAMVHAASRGAEKQVLEVKDIFALAQIS